MRNPVRFTLCFSLLLLCLTNAIVAQDLQFAQLGDFKLDSGQVIRDCRIGYRTFGKLNHEKSNAILLTSWASGTSEQLASNVGPGRLVDSTKYYVIAVDALSNGITGRHSIPQGRQPFTNSTSRRQP